MTTNNSWNSQDPAQVAKGGTGAATLTGVLTGNGTSAVTANAVTADKIVIGGASNAVASTGINVDGSDNVTDVTSIVPAGDRTGSLGSASLSWDNVYADGLTFDDGTNVMADYIEEGSFTPTILFGGASTGITYSSRSGYYTRIGNVVIWSMAIMLSSKGSATGAATIGSFPFTAALAHNQYTGVYPNNITAPTSTTAFFIEFVFNSTTINIFATGGSTSAQVTNTEFANNSLIRTSGSFRIQ